MNKLDLVDGLLPFTSLVSLLAPMSHRLKFEFKTGPIEFLKQDASLDTKLLSYFWRISKF
ncbi:hypothetical protein BpHYR1_035273 [Brachionus plicatilis]|uniref:Uncharacterized protein n=1 Tax=Brachionus plicatilis TaxID=10195 RepID=A0A3M7QAV2_BRAPC|nr:hypothetical protein BpHYR1_035273 [Brachionus plicatilis]